MLAQLAEATQGLELPPGCIDALARHFELLCAWDRRQNLTTITDPAEAAWLHYRDSLEGLGLLVPGGLVDLGSGGGFPGLVLAIATGRPTLLVEPRRKRASFLRTVIADLRLKAVDVHEGRAEDPVSRWPNVVTRATFSDPAELLGCRAWATPGGQLLAWRSEPLGGADVTHAYALGETRRVIQVWRAPSVRGAI